MVDKVFRSGAPEIERVFNLRNKRIPGYYCAVCLRSDGERRFVDNASFKKFILAVKLEQNWKPLQEPDICYMCNRQAVNALKFYRATQFASSINKIFIEIMLREKNSIKHIFHKTNFKELLMQLDLEDEKTLPSQWESELKIIRRRSQLNETRTLVIDSLGVQVGDLDNIVNSDQDKLTTSVLSKPVQEPKEPSNSHKSNNTINEGSKKKPITTYKGSKKYESRKSEGSSTQLKETVHLFDEPDRPIRPINVNIPEFILADEEVEEKDPLKVENVVSDSEDTLSTDNVECPESALVTSSDPHTQYSVTLSDPHTQDSVTSSDPHKQALFTSNDPPIIAPKLVPIEKLLKKPTKETNSEPEFLLHPIILNECGDLTVPTLTAHIVDGELVTNNIFLTSLINNQVMQNGQMPQTEANPQKRKVDMATQSKSNDVDMATQCKRKVLPLEAKPSVNKTIDWEDKIPMDVISFMDAVDPNFKKLSKYSMSPNIGDISSNDTSTSTLGVTRTQDTLKFEDIDL